MYSYQLFSAFILQLLLAFLEIITAIFGAFYFRRYYYHATACPPSRTLEVLPASPSCQGDAWRVDGLRRVCRVRRVP